MLVRMFERAVQLASRAHAGQTDKLGAPYIEHPLAVAELLGPAPEYVRAAAVLHDVVEDTDVTLEAVRQQFGARVASLVDALTHRAWETREDYLARIVAHGRWAVKVKRADVAHNTDPARMAALDDATRQRLVRKYARTLAVLDAI